MNDQASTAAPLPVKKGVSPNRLWLPQGEWESIYDYFHSKFPHLSTDDCLGRFKRGEMVTANGEVLSEQSAYKAGQHLYFYRELKDELQIPFEEKIIYQDERILVADKPHFLPVAPTGQYLHETLLVRLRIITKIDTLELCHRLDRETAGIVLLTKKPCYRHKYHQLFSDRKIKKTYHAITSKVDSLSKINDLPFHYRSKIIPDKDSMRMREIAGTANSETIIRMSKERGVGFFLEISPITGKKHQLRLHLSSMGMPIKNDPLYPTRMPKQPSDFENPLQLLAKSLQFTDPYSGQNHKFSSGQEL